jgi:hypothetical protein
MNDEIRMRNFKWRRKGHQATRRSVGSVSGYQGIRVSEPAFPGGLISWFSDIRFLIT